jgi:glycosyltransferase involved in cell wall biosynthesis
MRKCLFIAANEWSNWGGSELLWSSAAEKMVRRGGDISVSVPNFVRATPQVEQLRLAGCRMFYRRPFPPFLYRVARRVLPLPEYNRVQLRSAANGVDLVVISQGSIQDGLFWMEAARAEGLRYALIIQGVSDLTWPDDTHAERLAVSYENAVGTYFVSQANLELCRHQFASPLRRGKVIRNPFNVRYDARPPWPTQDGDTLSLACVARLDGSTKGHDLLLLVLSLPRWRTRNVRVSLIGRGMNERVLRGMAENLRLTNVEFAGHQNDIERVWSNHHALVLPSRFEGMPLTVVEAMLCGRPCIATDVGGNKELIRDGVNGFLAKAPTVELLDEAMNRAWECRGQLKGMGEKAAADVRAWVSADPGEDFARELVALVDGAK